MPPPRDRSANRVPSKELTYSISWAAPVLPKALITTLVFLAFFCVPRRAYGRKLRVSDYAFLAAPLFAVAEVATSFAFSSARDCSNTYQLVPSFACVETFPRKPVNNVMRPSRRPVSDVGTVMSRSELS